MAVLALAACSPGSFQFGSRTLDFGGGTAQTIPTQPTPILPSGPSQVFGRGPVPVALLLPLSGDPSLAGVGQSMANASRLAIAFIEQNPNIGENITITLRDTGGTSAGAIAAANAAITGGARLILGPLRGDEVTAAGSVARSAGIPMIGFSNNPGAAGPGVYLLSVLPDMEMKRAIRFVQGQGRRGLAGAFPATPYGEAMATAFRQQAIAAGLNPHAVYTFASAAEAQGIVNQALADIQKGLIDTLFIPDRATAPSFATLLAQAGIASNAVQLVGSADWEGDPSILATPFLAGAIYPAVDAAGLNAIRADYQANFGGAQPHALSTIAYTATILANVNTLSLAAPPYSAALLTSASGFNGRDGVFRFLANGRAEYALVVKQVNAGGAAVLDAARL